MNRFDFLNAGQALIIALSVTLVMWLAVERVAAVHAAREEVLHIASADARLTVLARERERHVMPPFGRLAALIVSSPDGRQADEAARVLARSRPADSRVQVLGPAPAPLAILRGRHRRRLLVKAPRAVNMQAFLRSWLDRAHLPNNVRVQVDVDPYSFM